MGTKLLAVWLADRLFSAVWLPHQIVIKNWTIWHCRRVAVQLFVAQIESTFNRWLMKKKLLDVHAYHLVHFQYGIGAHKRCKHKKHKIRAKG